MLTFLLSCNAWQIAVGGWLFFSAIYFVFGAINTALTRFILPRINYGGVLDHRPIQPSQLKRELLLSQLSIAIFGFGVVVPWSMLKLGWAALGAENAAWLLILAEVLALTLWNEIHFYLMHRLLHTAWLKRFHLAHHRSLTTTPWSTYSFHPIEAIMLGSVLLLPMSVYNFSWQALFALPVISLLFNNIGHSNYDFLPDARADRWWLNGARRHYLHHIHYHGNYGFMLPFVDRLLQTEIKHASPRA